MLDGNKSELVMAWTHSSGATVPKGTAVTKSRLTVTVSLEQLVYHPNQY